VHDSRGIEIVNFSISLALSAGMLMTSAGTPYRLVPAHFYPWSWTKVPTTVHKLRTEAEIETHRLTVLSRRLSTLQRSTAVWPSATLTLVGVGLNVGRDWLYQRPAPPASPSSLPAARSHTHTPPNSTENCGGRGWRCQRQSQANAARSLKASNAPSNIHRVTVR